MTPRLAACVLLVLLAGCTPGSAPRSDPEGPLRWQSAGAGETLHLSGQAQGAFPGIGPSVRIDAWLRADGRARVDLRSTGEDGRPTHEVLLWDRQLCFLFDARTGRFVELGEAEGRLDALDNHFALRDAVFLARGLDPVWPGDEATELIGDGARFRGVRESGTLRRDGDQAGLRWRAEDGTIHDIAVSYDDYFETSWGPWPLRLELTGTDLAAAARLRWDEPGPIVALGDSIFDPLWEPAAR